MSGPMQTNQRNHPLQYLLFSQFTNSSKITNNHFNYNKSLQSTLEMIFKYSLFIIVTILSLLNLPEPVSGRLETILGQESGRDKYFGQQENHRDLSDNKTKINIEANAPSPAYYNQTLKQVSFTGSPLFNVAWLANLFLFGSTIFIANQIIELTTNLSDWSPSTLFSDTFSNSEIDTTVEMMNPMIENIIGKLVPRWKF